MNPVEPISLRDRKKARTKAAIQTEALRLFTENGYENTTVEQIVASLDVSRATFFRYFPTKADLVLYDVVDNPLLRCAAQCDEHTGPIAAIRAAIRGLAGSASDEEARTYQQRELLLRTVPELRARVPGQIAAVAPLLTRALSGNYQLSAEDPRILAVAGAIIGAGIATWISAHDDIADGYTDRYNTALDAVLIELRTLDDLLRS
ncbi:TetR family transcriptional regulator [Nocardia sp. XZ_19_385]|uniref:TetR/AcrR family transcriptional regulator n=1 Tax=Nocardia sp. XZ_19_385 TaxID=2769488 RepID=UPI00188FD4A7|nr:TetR family transcriptional regulator [Nocardia sp. XZ_19_385]